MSANAILLINAEIIVTMLLVILLICLPIIGFRTSEADSSETKRRSKPEASSSQGTIESYTVRPQAKQTNDYGIGNEKVGVCLVDGESFKPELCSVIYEQEHYKLAYNNDTRLYVTSAEWVGKLMVYDRSYHNPQIKVKKSALIQKMQTHISSKVGKEVSLYSANLQAEYFYPFVCAQKNAKGQQCMNATVNGVAKMIPIEELEEKVYKFKAVLKSGSVKK